ncbi:sister chromatid cohesion protein PDS5 homolog C isoform X2 [Lycium barbarum]|uniref:sister chromatid cohesion protein PDS5 homolog C isoform X2 n=1 Tax=Lycium barbarum TaxID=112863 RepID=UPI00293E0403|nr:sister chromatid cohesion protein PDS5 homolog C isoform X2 [Lycium barbarum]
MAASCSSCTASLEEELTAYGIQLMNPPSSTDELFNLLHKVESILIMVGQRPSDSTRSALQPVMKALIGNELLSHMNEDVKVSVVSCITELCRITAPQHPYDNDKQMKEILQHTVMALKKLSDVSGRSYYAVVKILESVAKLRACVMLLDLEYDTLVIEIFKLFLGIIRPYHPHNVFTKMEEIMTQLIEDSDELSVELLWPLLDSVKKENQIASPVSSKLGEKVLEDCAAIVKPYLAEALMSMSLNLDDCAEIVASICNEIPKGQEMMANENAPDTVHPVKVGPSEAKFFEPALQDDTHREKLKDACRTNIMKPDNPEDVQPATNAEVVSRSNKLTGSSGQRCSASKNPDIISGSHGHWGPPKKKESPTNEDDHLGVLVPAGDVSQSQVKKKDSLHLGLTSGERTKGPLCAKRKRGRDSRKIESVSNCDRESKSEFSIKNEEGNIKEKEPSLQQIDGMKQQNNEFAIKIHNIEESGDKATKLSDRDENHLNKCTNYKSGRKSATGKHEDSKRPRTIKDHGEELVGARIKVWWPLDDAFYEAVISSFDPVKKKHKVVYVDGVVAHLTLQKERWEMLEDNSSQKVDTHRKQLKDTSASGIKQKKKKKKTNIKVHNIEESGDKDSKRPRTIKDYGEELVGARIKVWWPLDEKFYEATISSFDPVKRKHEVVYVDGVVERLTLHKELWEMLEDNSSQKVDTHRKQLKDTSSSGIKQKKKKKKTNIKVHNIEEHGDKDSKRPRIIKDYGEELVGARIKVWWPLDEKFYEATISSFDPVKRKHEVLYVDGIVEILSLHKERWEMLEDNSSQKDHGIDFQGLAVSSVTLSDTTPPLKTYFRRK